MTTALAFEGCSCRAAFHVGVSEWLEARGWRPDVVVGASSGAMVAAAVATERTDALWAHWEELLDVTDIWQPRRLLRGRWPVTMSHVLRPALHRHFGEAELGDTAIPLGIAVTQLRRGGRTRRILTAADPVRIATAVAASSFIPGIYSRMVPIDRRPTVDGAWDYRLPLDAADALGATRTLAVVTNPEGRRLGGIVPVRALPWPPDTAVIAPRAELPIQGFDFDATRTEGARQMGHEAAEHFARTHEGWL